MRLIMIVALLFLGCGDTSPPSDDPPKAAAWKRQERHPRFPECGAYDRSCYHPRTEMQRCKEMCAPRAVKAVTVSTIGGMFTSEEPYRCECEASR